MIKETELRIGNLIGYLFQRYPDLNKIVTVDSILGNQIQATSGEFVLLEQEAIPIPLTEEWLLKFGFEKSKKLGALHEFEKDNLQLIFNGVDYDAFLNSEEHGFGEIGTSIKYVHQLQNLFFALTGTELTLKNELEGHR